jgi:hypothetical protein
MSMKNSNETFGNRTRDLQACSIVPHICDVETSIMRLSGPDLHRIYKKKMANLNFVSRVGKSVK